MNNSNMKKNAIYFRVRFSYYREACLDFKKKNQNPDFRQIFKLTQSLNPVLTDSSFNYHERNFN